MGLSAEPQSLHDLHGLDDRIEAKDIAGLIDDIASMPVSGRPFARLLHAKGEDRIFGAEGRIAEPELVGDGGVVRSDERRVGKEGFGTCRSRRGPYPSTTKKQQIQAKK